MSLSKKNVIVMILLFTSILTISSVNTTLASSHSNIEITTDTAWEDTTVSYTNQSVIVNNTATLTISNTTVDFQNYADTGFLVDNGSLVVINSVIKGGGKCITGYNTGNVTLINSTISGCASDAVELEGDYNLDIQNSEFIEISNRALDLLNLPTQAIVNNTLFYNTSSDAIRFENMDMFILNSDFDIIGDDAVDSRGNGVLDMRNSVISRAAGDGFNLDDDGSTFLTDLQIFDIIDDGIQYDGNGILEVRNSLIYNLGGDGIVIGGVADIYISNVGITNTGDEGIQADFVEIIEIRDTEIDAPGADGIDISFATGTISIVDTQVDGSSSSDGIQISSSNATTIITGLESLNNAQNGIELTNVTNVTLLNTVGSLNTASGLEVFDSGSITIEDSQFNSNFVGIWFNNSNSLDIQRTEVKNNDIGFLLGYSQSVTVGNSDIVGNTVAVNATGMVTDTVDMRGNYWGTTVSEDIVLIGDVLIDPILDSNGNTYTTPITPTESSTPEEDDTDTGGLSLHIGLMMLLGIGTITLLKKKRNL